MTHKFRAARAAGGGEQVRQFLIHGAGIKPSLQQRIAIAGCDGLITKLISHGFRHADIRGLVEIVQALVKGIVEVGIQNQRDIACCNVADGPCDASYIVLYQEEQ